MNTLFLILMLVFLKSCVSQSATDKSQNISSNQTPTANQVRVFDANANKYILVQDAKPEIDETQRKEIEARNAEFEVVPDEWKHIDFENFTYPTSRMKDSIHLKNGEFRYSNRKEYDDHFGSSGNKFYVDLVGDATKEAIVFVIDSSCGGSCDGGSEIIYFYSIQSKEPKLLGRIEAGSRAYGCSIKSFEVKNKEITIEQFGNCKKKSDDNEGDSYLCKFCVKDLTVSTYAFTNSKLKRKSCEIVSSPVVNVKNFTGEIYSIQ